MTQNPYQSLLDLAKETASTLLARGRVPTVYSDDDGRSTEGWELEVLSDIHTDERIGPRGRKVYRNKVVHFLATDGAICRWAHLYENISFPGGVTEDYSHTQIRDMKPAGLVGITGKPFSEIAAKLERLKWS